MDLTFIGIQPYALTGAETPGRVPHVGDGRNAVFPRDGRRMRQHAADLNDDSRREREERRPRRIRRRRDQDGAALHSGEVARVTHHHHLCFDRPAADRLTAQRALVVGSAADARRADQLRQFGCLHQERHLDLSVPFQLCPPGRYDVVEHRRLPGAPDDRRHFLEVQQEEVIGRVQPSAFDETPGQCQIPDPQRPDHPDQVRSHLLAPHVVPA